MTASTIPPLSVWPCGTPFGNKQEGPDRLRSAPITDPLSRDFGVPNRFPDPLVQRAGRDHPFPIFAGAPWRERDIARRMRHGRPARKALERTLSTGDNKGTSQMTHHNITVLAVRRRSRGHPQPAGERGKTSRISFFLFIRVKTSSQRGSAHAALCCPYLKGIRSCLPAHTVPNGP
jgi:hypothetical protein